MAQRVDKRHKRQIRKLMDHVQCTNGFRCAKSEFKDLCRAKDISGSGEHLMCMEDPGAPCGFQIPHGHGTLCHCQVRFYLHMEMRL